MPGHGIGTSRATNMTLIAKYSIAQARTVVYESLPQITQEAGCNDLCPELLPCNDRSGIGHYARDADSSSNDEEITLPSHLNACSVFDTIVWKGSRIVRQLFPAETSSWVAAEIRLYFLPAA